jgi:hypothetical protein
MHWFAANNAAGTNFHNYQWIPTDTIIPGDLTTYLERNVNSGYACTDSVCSNWIVNPKGFGIKAFDMGGHGYTVGVTALETGMPDSGSVDTYAVGSGQDLYVTLVNKTDATNTDDTASVTIDIGTGEAPFAATSVATLLLWNGDTHVPSDPTQAQPPTPPASYTPASLGFPHGCRPCVADLVLFYEQLDSYCLWSKWRLNVSGHP